MTLRIINLGLPKSGTTTLAKALTSAGLVVADFRIRRATTPVPELGGSFVGRQLYDGYFQTGDPLVRLTAFDALSELSVLNTRLCLWPQTDFGLIDAIRTRHPDIRFVASRRASDDMSLSMLRWSDLGASRLPIGAVPGLPRGYGETSAERARWIDAHYAFLARVFQGDPHYLEYDTTAPDARARLETHLKLALPWWGKANENLETPVRAIT